jgi:NAD(P)-dependent dehydrogenase (short-subunit alcohol dehydrogenase family)
MKKIVLVTGSNKGIGLEIVNQLASMGHEAIIASRNLANGKMAQDELLSRNRAAHLIELDITTPGSITHAVHWVNEQFGGLDVLINNAAILLRHDQSLLKDDMSIYENTIVTNAHAHLAVTRQFLPLMKRGSRVIMTSSGGGSMTDPVGGWSPAYCVSKTLLNSITRQLAYELADKQISVNAFCPGWVRTDMGGASAPRGVQQGADTAVWLATADKIPTGRFFRDRKEIKW